MKTMSLPEKHSFLQKLLSFYMENYRDLVESCCAQLSVDLNVLCSNSKQFSLKPHFRDLLLVTSTLSRCTRDTNNSDSLFQSMLAEFNCLSYEPRLSTHSCPSKGALQEYTKEKNQCRSLRVLSKQEDLRKNHQDWANAKTEQLDRKFRQIELAQEMHKSSLEQQRKSHEERRARTAENKRRLEKEFLQKCLVGEHRLQGKPPKSPRPALHRPKSKLRPVLPEDDGITALMQQLSDKLESKQNLHQKTLLRRVLTAKEHTAQVELRRQEFLRQKNAQEEEMLLKLIEKSRKTREKRGKKTSLQLGVTEKLRGNAEYRADRHMEACEQRDRETLSRERAWDARSCRLDLARQSLQYKKQLGRAKQKGPHQQVPSSAPHLPRCLQIF